VLKILMSILLTFLSLEGGEWKLIGFSNAPVKWVRVHPENPDVIFASTDEGLFRSVDKGITWKEVRDGFHYLFFDPSDSLKVYALLSNGSYSAGLYLSKDLGDNWSPLFYIPYPTSLTFPSYGSHTMVLGTKGEGVWRSDNSGSDWQEMNQGLENLDVLSITMVEPTGSVFYPIAGTEGGVYFWDYRGGYWTLCPNTQNLSAKGLSIYGKSGPIWIALGAGTHSDGIYVSKDFGHTWEVSKYITYPTYTLVNQFDSNTVYAADSGEGVLITRDGGRVWNLMNEGLGNLYVLSLSQSVRDTLHLYAGTCAGLWVYEFPCSVEEEIVSKGLKVKISKVSQSRVSISYYLSQQFMGKRIELKVFDVMGRVIVNSLEEVRRGWNYQTLRLNRGVYFIRLRIGSRERGGKVVIY